MSSFRIQSFALSYYKTNSSSNTYTKICINRSLSRNVIAERIVNVNIQITPLTAQYQSHSKYLFQYHSLSIRTKLSLL